MNSWAVFFARASISPYGIPHVFDDTKQYVYAVALSVKRDVRVGKSPAVCGLRCTRQVAPWVLGPRIELVCVDCLLLAVQTDLRLTKYIGAYMYEI